MEKTLQEKISAIAGEADAKAILEGFDKIVESKLAEAKEKSDKVLAYTRRKLTEKANEYGKYVIDEMSKKGDAYGEYVRQQTIEEMTKKAEAYAEYVKEEMTKKAEAYAEYVKEEMEKAGDSYGEYVHAETLKEAETKLINKFTDYVESIHEEMVADMKKGLVVEAKVSNANAEKRLAEVKKLIGYRERKIETIDESKVEELRRRNQFLESKMASMAEEIKSLKGKVDENKEVETLKSKINEKVESLPVVHRPRARRILESVKTEAELSTKFEEVKKQITEGFNFKGTRIDEAKPKTDEGVPTPEAEDKDKKSLLKLCGIVPKSK